MPAFDDADTGAHPGRVVRELCELLATERSAAIVAQMESWMRARRGRRLVDFRFMTDAELCSVPDFDRDPTRASGNSTSPSLLSPMRLAGARSKFVVGRRAQRLQRGDAG